MNSASDIIALVTTLLIISLLVNLYFINNRIINSRKEKRQGNIGDSSIKNYLLSQSEKTRFYKGTEKVPALNSRVVKFRSAYLMIEEKAFERRENPDGFWSFIDDKVRQLIEIMLTYASNPTLESIEKKIKSIKNIVKKSDGIDDKDVIFSCLDRFYKSCEENSNINRLKRYDTKLNDILSKISDTQYSKADRLMNAHGKYSQTTLDAIRATSSPHQLKRAADGSDNVKVDKLVHGINANSQKLDDSLSSIKNNIDTMDQSIVSSTGNDQQGGRSKTSSQELELLSEELQQKSEIEIRKLKRTVRDQKVSISELESELSRIAKQRKQSGSDSTEQLGSDHDLERELAALKQNLTQSEQCIQILESELESLRTQVGDTKGGIGGGDISELESTIKKLEASLKLSEESGEYLRSFVEFTKESVTLESLEDLAVYTHTVLGELGYSGQFLVKTSDRQFVVSDSGSISEKLKVLLGNLALDESSLTSDKKSMFCRKPSFGCVVTSKNGSLMSSAEATKVMSVLDVCDGLMRKICGGANQKDLLKSLGDYCDDIKHKSQDLDYQLNSIFIALIKAVETSANNVQSLARASGMSASNIAKLKNYENDIMDEIEDSKLINLKVKKAFLAILNDIENLT